MAGGKRGGQGGRGAKPYSHRKGAQRGSGGKGRKALQGKGPTPPAEQRYGHPAARSRGAGKGSPSGSGGGSGARGRSGPPGKDPGSRTGAGKGEVIAGRNPAVEALRGGVPASALYVADKTERDDRVTEALRTASNIGVPVHQVSRAELDRLAQGTDHQGLALQVAPYEYAHSDDLLARARDTGQAPLLVALDGVTDPHNLGAIARSTAALGGHGIIVPERRAAGVTSGAWKASAGALARVPVARVPNLARALTAYQSEGLFAVGLAGSGEMPLPSLELAADPLVLVIGSERNGLSRLVAQKCDMVVRVPMAADVESLNASVAAGVALYEVARRRS